MLCALLFIFTPISSAFYGAHVVVYQSNCRYLPYSIRFYEFFNFFTRKWAKHENTRSLPFSHEWPPTVNERAKHQYWDSFNKKFRYAMLFVWKLTSGKDVNIEASNSKADSRPVSCSYLQAQRKGTQHSRNSLSACACIWMCACVRSCVCYLLTCSFM